MSDKFSCKIEDCDGGGPTLASLRSHVAATKDDDHQEARKAKAWEEWYPDEEGASEGGSDPSDEGTADPSDDDPPESTDGEGDEGGSPTPSEGGPDPSEEYAEQWSAGDTGGSSEESGGSEGGSDPSEKGGSGRSGGTDGGDNGIGAGVALAAGSALVGLVVLLTRNNDDEEPIEVESTAADVDPDAEGDAAPSGGGWNTVEEGDGW